MLQPTADAPAAEASSTPSALRVLVVDDHRAAADNLAAVLHFWHFEARVAYSGPEALDLAASFRPHLVLLDFHLPGMDGGEVAAALRDRQGPTATGPVLIAYSGLSSPDVAARGVPFDHIMAKPIDLARLEATLREVDRARRY